MKKCRFDVVILLGQGVIARKIVQYIESRRIHYGFQFQCIVHEMGNKNPLVMECKKSGIACNVIEDKLVLTNYLSSYMDNRVLIISAFNNYWFPKRIVDCSNFTIINYHNSYLPKYQGGNAITWAIFNREETTGATWHYVTSKVDDGNIIWQERFCIKEEAKAYEVSKESMGVAFEGFCSFFTELIQYSINGKKQVHPGGKRDLHFFSDLPMDGTFSVKESTDIVYRLLRSMDYGKTAGWPKTRVVLPDGELAAVKSYRIVDRVPDDIAAEQGTIYMRFNEDKSLKIVTEGI